MGLEFKLLDQLGEKKIQEERLKKPWFSGLFNYSKGLFCLY